MQTENGEHQDPGADHPPEKSRSLNPNAPKDGLGDSP